jgi:hypothetical protein
MTEPRRRTAWSVLADEWDPDHPAIRRMREALALEPTPERPQPAQDGPGRPEPVAVASESTPAPDESTRRNRIAELVARVQAGDLSAVDVLRRTLSR